MNNDLLTTIAGYATPGLAMDLLVSFAPIKAYGDVVWKTKAMVESRGLMVDDSVVNSVVGGCRWYAYYLIRNRTFCGDLLKIMNTKGAIGKTRTRLRDIIYCGYCNMGDRRCSVLQHRDLTIKVANHTININRKIREVMETYKSRECLYLLDEYGDVWRYCFADSSLGIVIKGEGLLAIKSNYQSETIAVLNRCGQLRYLKSKKYVPVPKIVDVPHAVHGVGHCFFAITHTGTPITVDRMRHGPASQRDVPVHDGERYLHGNITTHLTAIRYSSDLSLRIIDYPFNTVFTTADRTTYVNVYIKRLGWDPAACVTNTKNRTQKIAVGSSTSNKDVHYAIVDHYAEWNGELSEFVGVFD